MSDKPAGYHPWPADFKILETIPKVGMIGGVHWNGKRSQDITEIINAAVGEKVITGGQVSSRLKELNKQGYVKWFTGGASGKRIWARTDEGEAFLATKEAVLQEALGETGNGSHSEPSTAVTEHSVTLEVTEPEGE